MKLKIFPLYCLLVVILFSCVNDENEVKRITDFEYAPDEQSQNLRIRQKMSLMGVLYL